MSRDTGKLRLGVGYAGFLRVLMSLLLTLFLCSDALAAEIDKAALVSEAAESSFGAALLPAPFEEPQGSAPKRSAHLEAGLQASVAVAGASSAYLVPGPMEPELTGITAARPFLAWRGQRFDATLTYAPLLHRQMVNGVTGILHDGTLGLRAHLADGWTVDSLVFGGLAGYEASGGPVDEASTVSLLATRSRSAGGGAGFRYDPKRGPGFRGAAVLTRRQSRAIFIQEEPIFLEELFVEGSALVDWRLTRRVEVLVGPVFEMRQSGRDHLSYRGAGLQASSAALAWPGGGFELSLRAQGNVFSGDLARSDIFARAGVVAWQRAGDRARVSARYTYTGNGSALAAYDADRHVLLLSISARTPTWRR